MKSSNRLALAQFMRYDSANKRFVRLGLHKAAASIVCYDKAEAVRRLRKGEALYVDDGDTAVAVMLELTGKSR